MRSFHDVSIRTKLILLLVGVVSLASLINFGASTISDTRRIKAAMAEHHSVLADVLGVNSTAALNFEAPSSAEEVLSSLRLEPTVSFACTYDAKGAVFATYKANDILDFSAPPVGAEGTSFSTDGHLEVFKRITQEKKTLGTIYLRVSMERLNAQIRYNITITTIVLIAALATALLLGWGLQRGITEPIYQLAQATKTVSQSGDYSLRVQKQANDEMGLLSDGFNAMLAQIQQRDAELEHHRLHLEKLVQERTRSLEVKTQELATSNTALQAEIVQREQVGKKLRETAAELALTNKELEQFNRLMVGREERMLELKRQINELSQSLGRSAPFDLSFGNARTEGIGP